ncbi:MAG: hypothetical protein GY862_00080, partial [Gammaproteobacteria bacterium]|nr:hypothetical protein [Gammaproteobacteria bacterium]
MSLFKAAKRKSAEKPGENKSTPRYVPLKYAIMTSFLMLVIPGLVILSFFSYSDTRNDMENAYSQLQDQTKNTVFNAIKLVDAGYQVLENFLNKKMKKGFARFDEAYEKTGRDAAKIDLKALKEHLGGKMDLYMINADGVVEYTTYTKDLNLDFKSKSPKFYQELTAIREKNEFVSGGMTAEARTGRVRKYAYMPTADNRYVMELGLVSDEFKTLLG